MVTSDVIYFYFYPIMVPVSLAVAWGPSVAPWLAVLVKGAIRRVTLASLLVWAELTPCGPLSCSGLASRCHPWIVSMKVHLPRGGR
jgi:hypothetical protein